MELNEAVILIYQECVNHTCAECHAKIDDVCIFSQPPYKWKSSLAKMSRSRRGSLREVLRQNYHTLKCVCVGSRSKERGYKGICQEWTGEGGFSRFAEWAFEQGYDVGYKIVRIDSDKPMEPSNCALRKKSVPGSRLYELDGELVSVKDILDRIGHSVETDTVRKMLREGQTPAQIIQNVTEFRNVPQPLFLKAKRFIYHFRKLVRDGVISGTICQEWSDAKTFALWLVANGYEGKSQLKRYDPEGEFSPSNCYIRNL